MQVLVKERIAQETTTALPETLDLEMAITGMSCAACVRRIEKALSRVPGVASASVNLATERALVAIDPVEGPAADILIAAVVKAGYGAEMHYPEPLAIAAQAESDIGRRNQLAEDRKNRLMAGIVLTVPILILHMFLMGFLPGIQWMLLCLTVPVWLYTGWEFHRGALQALRHGSATMDVLVSLGSTAALGLSLIGTIAPRLTGGAMYFDTTALIITLVSLGKYLEARARAQASRAISELMRLQPETAWVVRQGEEREVALAQVHVGDEIVVRPGQRIPVDGAILHGTTTIDTSLLTGESLPVEAARGQKVVGGTINLTGLIHLRATQIGSATVLAGIIRTVERAQASKAPIQRVADQVAGIFVPVVIGLALLTFVGWWAASDLAHFAMQGIWGGAGTVAGVLAPTWIRALTAGIAVLVVACPCALGLATPIAIIVGTSRGAEQGILIKDGASLERAQAVTAILLDKTGTMTTGHPTMTHIYLQSTQSAATKKKVGREVHRKGSLNTRSAAPSLPSQPTWNEAEVLRLAAGAESGSLHPLAQAVVQAAQARTIVIPAPLAVQEIAGQGIKAHVESHTVWIGQRALFQSEEMTLAALETFLAKVEQAGETGVIVAIDGLPVAVLSIADTVRPDTAAAIADLQAQGRQVWMVTGDSQRVATAIARSVGIAPEHVLAGVMPEAKAQQVARLRHMGEVVAFVGDGINDAPALASADVGIALGTGTEIALEAADVTLVQGSLGGVARALALSRQTMQIIRQNLVWAFGYNAVLIPLAIASPAIPFLQAQAPIFAAGAMTLSSVTVVTNALRLRGSFSFQSLGHAFQGQMQRLPARQKALLAIGVVALALSFPWLLATVRSLGPAAPTPTIMVQNAGSYHVTLTFANGAPHAGTNVSLRLQVLGSDGKPVPNAAMTWTFEMEVMDMGVSAGKVAPAPSGTYAMTVTPLMDGFWRLSARLSVPGGAPQQVVFQIPVRG